MRFTDGLEQIDPAEEKSDPDTPSTNVVITGVRLDFGTVFGLVLMVTIAQAVLVGLALLILHRMGVF